ncbi:MAG: amidohydrolase family protein, partial [Sphaerochaetaceae bacterium]|nr:amidohydrolase family protein [Sphaerochaetaceae bacterium]
GQPYMVKNYLCGCGAYFDTSFSRFFMSEGLFTSIIRENGIDKILYGTDGPWGSPINDRPFIDSLNLTREEKEMIYCENAKKILGL